MTISLRVDEKLAQQLEGVARARGVSKSEVVRLCLEEFLAREQTRPTAWELGKDLFGRHSSGRGDLSENSEEIVSELIHAKAHRR
jgi:RHH-type rel operon transcriptional repressor/antitoxin RelB